MATTIADLTGGAGGWSGTIVGYDGLNDRNNLKGAQTFTVISGTWNVSSVKLRLDRDFTAEGSPENGDLTLSIREDSPTGSILGTSAIERTTVSLTESWQSFPFSGVSLIHGNTYCLVLECPYGFSNIDFVSDDLQWIYRDNFYNDGIRYYTYDELGSWTTGGQDRDHRAEVIGVLALPSKPINPTPADTASDIKLSYPTLSWESGS